ncbi:MAG: diguanylate cyclase domain-containing protein [Omnitrophica WOR_2 bacterium]
MLIEDDYEYAHLLEKTIELEAPSFYEIKNAFCVGECLEILAENSFDVILLDLILPDCQGLETFKRVHQQVPETAIIILTAMEDEGMADIAVREGAQDYLFKTEIDGRRIIRAMHYAVERQTWKMKLQSMALIDDLTGLYNRRGFTSLYRKYLKLSQRSNKSFLLIYADLDRLKIINDTYGHQEGDRVLIEVAQLLKDTFRESDIVARIGGDEFTILAMDVPDQMGDMLSARLEANLESKLARDKRPYRYSISLGIARCHPDEPQALEDLLAEADASMYVEKHRKRITS